MPKFRSILILLLILHVASCGREEVYTPVVIDTNPDLVTMSQNSSYQIFIFENDSSLPIQGTLSITEPTKGFAIIQDINNTPNVATDDSVMYTVNTNNVGEDSFQYTICDDISNNNCKTEIVRITINSLSQVNFSSENIPYNSLSQYNFFEGVLSELNPTFGVLPYELISPLFSDYAKKERFLWMPNNVKATYNADDKPLDFPNGTVLIKNFYYDDVLPNLVRNLIETRLMFKTVQGWDFANYIWNAEQTDAFYSAQGSNLELNWIKEGVEKSVNYRIPSRAECFTCHNSFGTPLPIGPKPQNMNMSYSYVGESTNQLDKLVQLGYLNNDLPNNIESVVKWDDETNPLDLRVRSYIDINCAHCHSDESYCEYRSMRFAYSSNGINENMGICEEPETQFIPNSKIISPGNTDLSILFYRINTTEQSLRMPLFGRTLKHDEGVRLIEEWINSLDVVCN